MESQPVTDTPLPAPPPRPLPSPRAWVAEAYVDAEGRETNSAGAAAAAAVFAVSVHEKFPTELTPRTELLRQVLSSFGPSVPAGVDSLWLLPAGYYGYDAALNDWTRRCDAAAVEEALRGAVAALPPRATLAVGVDADGSNQQAWVYHPAGGGGGGVHERRAVTRDRCDLPARVVRVGPFAASFFVCGEIMNWDLSKRLVDVQILADLSHRRVPKGTTDGAVNPRWAHDARLRRFARGGGVGVLAHHHGGGSRFNCQSNWIICRGDPPRYGGRVTPVP